MKEEKIGGLSMVPGGRITMAMTLKDSFSACNRNDTMKHLLK